ncbi:MAG: hypothetical protein H6868_06865 [Rhodospirillales bacterium]|nr:hypothetical protein [Rhodospirillales bacterium]
MPYNYELCFKTPKNRWIFVPTNECQDKGYEFVDAIKEKWGCPDYFYHFKSGGHLAAIGQHRESACFAKIDLTNFFPSISKSRVIRALKDIGVHYELAEKIAGWSTVRDKEDRDKYVLPYGFVQSQLLASICLDKSAIGHYLEKDLPEDILVTVYVDDIILSSDDKKSLDYAYNGLLEAVDRSGFAINEAKSHGRNDNVTAFNIGINDNELQIIEDRFSEFQKAVESGGIKRRDAIINYVNSVCPAQASILVG